MMGKRLGTGAQEIMNKIKEERRVALEKAGGESGKVADWWMKAPEGGEEEQEEEREEEEEEEEEEEVMEEEGEEAGEKE